VTSGPAVSRRALPLGEAARRLGAATGRQFDPAIIEALDSVETNLAATRTFIKIGVRPHILL
jgi:response regulator RpfG family c-di-GMP phosphodiesterase